MKTPLRLLFLLLAWMVLSPSKVNAQAEGTAFSCDGTFYQIRQVGTTSSLFRVNRSAAAYTTTPINVRTVNGVATNDLGVLLNGLSYNPQDGYLYALSTTGTSNTVPAAGTIRLYKIGQGGIQDLGATNLPAIQVASGTIDKDGFYYVSSQNSAGTANYNLYRFNIGAATPAARLTATALPLRNATDTGNLNVTFYDLALNPADNSLYGVFNNGTLWRINANGTSTNAPVTIIDNTQTNTDPVGTAFFDVAGNLFVYTNGTVGTANSGGFYQVNLTNGAYTLISTIDPASVSDGASCINPDQRIDVVKEVTNITRVNATTFDVSFSIRVKNTSTATDANVQVNDFLWSGSANTQRANTTFSSVANQLASSVTFTAGPTLTADPANVNPVFSLVRNTGYTGVGGAAGTSTGALLTGNQPLTAGQAAIITFTVRVVYGTANPNNVPAGVTNTAYASSTTTTNTTGYAQNTTSGFISAPGQLVATDRSTDGPSLPTTANDDTPTPTPVYFSPSISGTVFEDINYGGGLGRSQTASAGIGVEGVRVELYSAAGNFLTFTTTDAAGNYAFSTTNGTTALTAGTQYRVRVVNSTVGSNRLGYAPNSGLAGVQTYIYGATTQNQIGGANPVLADLQANTGTATGTGGQTLTQLQTTNATGAVVQSIATVTTPSTGNTTSPALLGVDFGFNFSTVVNTNDTGAGSLRQFILNSNALTNENLVQKSSVPGVTLTTGQEYAIFMINDGTTTTNGLRAGIQAGSTAGTYTAATGFTISPATALPTITDESTAIDGALQAAVTGNKVAAVGGTTTGAEVTINFASRTNLGGLLVTGGSTRIASLTLNGARGTSLNTTNSVLSDGAAVTFSGAGVAGSIITDVTGTGNAIASVLLQNSATDVTVSNNIFRTGAASPAATGAIAYDGAGILLLNAPANTISGNTLTNNNGFGIKLVGTSNENNITGNTISSNGAGVPTTDNAGISITGGNNNLISANTISSNSGDGIVALAGTSGNRITQNIFSANTELGIDLTATTAVTGDELTKNADNKATTNPTGANGLLNFPVITQASRAGNVLRLTGYAPTGSTIELYVADVATATTGEGLTYIGSFVEGSASDTDPKIGSYTGLMNDVDQGSETRASAFFFTLPFSSLNAAQQSALTAANARLTATATVFNTTTVAGTQVGNTSEFSGNAPIKATALPVTLVSFKAEANGLDTKLVWATSQELNNDRFVVERSFDAATFQKVGEVKGQGTTSIAHNYSFVDGNVGAKAQGTVYYRLRQVDLDGTATLSTVQTVHFTAATDVTVYPNPTSATSATRLNLSALSAGTYQVTVTDLAGRTVRVLSQQGGTAEVLALDNLPKGTYLLSIQGNGQTFTKRLIKE